MDLELRHLRYFAAVAEELHFGRAAERLHIAQPSLSQQIRRLEEILGVELFDRSRRAIALTAAGEALAAATRRTFDDIGSAVRATREAAEGKTGHLTVGFVETAAISIVPKAARVFRGTHPGIALELRDLPGPAQTEQLLRGSLELGFVRADPAQTELIVERRFEEDFVVAVPADHRLAGRDAMEAVEVVGESLILIEREILPGLHDETLGLVREHGETLHLAQRATSILSILGLVSAGIGIALLPASVRDLSLTDVHYAELLGSPRTTVLAVRHREHRSPWTDPFLDAIAHSGTAG